METDRNTSLYCLSRHHSRCFASVYVSRYFYSEVDQLPIYLIFKIKCNTSRCQSRTTSLNVIYLHTTCFSLRMSGNKNSDQNKRLNKIRQFWAKAISIVRESVPNVNGMWATRVTHAFGHGFRMELHEFSSQIETWLSVTGYVGWYIIYCTKKLISKYKWISFLWKNIVIPYHFVNQ